MLPPQGTTLQESHPPSPYSGLAQHCPRSPTLTFRPTDDVDALPSINPRLHIRGAVESRNNDICEQDHRPQTQATRGRLQWEGDARGTCVHSSAASPEPLRAGADLRVWPQAKPAGGPLATV